MTKFYKHKQIARFCVGRFQFENHFLAVEDTDLEDFLREHEGLAGVDRTNIVEVLNLENERSINRTNRGATDTASIKDGSKAKSESDFAAERATFNAEREKFEIERAAFEKAMLAANQSSAKTEAPAEVVKNDAGKTPAEVVKAAAPATPDPAPKFGGLKLS